MTNRLDSAIDTIRSAFPLWHQAGDVAGLSAAYEARAVFEYYNARLREAETLVDRAAELAREASPLGYGTALATRGHFAMQRGDFTVALSCQDTSHPHAEEEDSEALALRSGFVSAASDLAADDEAARELLIGVVDPAVAHGMYELASTCYSNLGNLDVEQRRLRAADLVLEEALPFTVEHDIPICHFWQTGVRSRLRLLQGRWSAGLEEPSTCWRDRACRWRCCGRTR